MRDDGPLNAKLVICGEAPGPNELVQGIPFVGASGAKMAEWMGSVGLHRHDAYWTNVVWDHRPTNIDRVGRERCEAYFETLHERIAALEDPWVIVPTGNYALYALTQKGKVSWHQRDGRLTRPGITKWRGSILPYVDRRGRALKVVPTIHPAATFARGKAAGKKAEQYAWVSAVWDWPRIAAELRTRDLALPDRIHHTAPTAEEAIRWLEALPPGCLVAVDVETPRPNKRSKPFLGCVGFAVSALESMTIPTTDAYWRDTFAHAAVRDAIRDALATHPVVMHNGMFDAYWLAHEGMPVATYLWDTLAMHTALWARLPHDLAFLGTTLTRQPYWKDEAKDPDEIARFATNNEALWHYNGIDCCVTFECWERLYTLLERRGSLGTYRQNYGALARPLVAASRRGVAVDDERRRARLAAATADLDAAKQQVGHLVKATGLSGHAVKFALYGARGLPEKKREEHVARFTGQGIVPLNLPVQYKVRRGAAGDTRSVSADHVTLLKLGRRFPQVAPLLEGLLAFQRASSKRKQLQPKADPDGRMRCLFNFVSTRLSSSTNPLGTGDNMQNRDRELRDIFVPDPGCWFVKFDMSQIENRIELMLTRDPEMIRLARSKPWEVDMHTENAALVCGIPIANVAKADRKLGKESNHAAQRGMGAAMMQERLLLQGIVKTIDECQTLLDRYFKRYAPIKDYFKDIRMEVARTRCLASTWSDVVTFPYTRLDEASFGFAYSWLPQVEARGIVNAGLRAYAAEEATGAVGTRFHLQVHDELLFSVEPDVAWDFARWMVARLEQPRCYFGEEMTVPVTIALGTSWACEREWKQLPARDAFVLDDYDDLTFDQTYANYGPGD